MYKFSSDDFIEEVNKKIYITPLLFFAKTKNIFKADERKFPVDFGSAFKEKYTVNIDLPNGYNTEKIPSNKAIGIKNDIGVFKFQITVIAKNIKVISVLEFKKSIISSKDYQELKELYKQLVEKQTEKIVLVKE